MTAVIAAQHLPPMAWRRTAQACAPTPIATPAATPTSKGGGLKCRVCLDGHSPDRCWYRNPRATVFGGIDKSAWLRFLRQQKKGREARTDRGVDGLGTRSAETACEDRRRELEAKANEARAKDLLAKAKAERDTKVEGERKAASARLDQNDRKAAVRPAGGWTSTDRSFQRNETAMTAMDSCLSSPFDFVQLSPDLLQLSPDLSLLPVAMEDVDPDAGRAAAAVMSLG